MTKKEIFIQKKESVEIFSDGPVMPKFDWLAGHGKVRFLKVRGSTRYWKVEPLSDFAILRVVRFEKDSEFLKEKDVIFLVFVDTSVYETEVDLE